MFEIGSSLREARIRQGLDLSSAEQATKIRGKYLRALEEEQFDVLPAETYVKGFMRNYADFLGLDGQLYVDEFNSRFGSAEEEYVPAVRRGASTVAHRRIESNVVLIALGTIGLVAALVIVAWKFGGEDANGPQDFVPKSPPAASGANAQGSPAGRARRPARARLVVRATRGGCRLVVRNGSERGQVLFRGILEPGERGVWVKRRIWLYVGAPRNVTVRVNGKRKRLPSRGAPTNVLVTPQRIAKAPDV